jgi:hypothetical protein
MTARIGIALISIRRLTFPTLRLPRIHISQTLADLTGAYGRALEMAHVEPYQISQRRSAAVSEETSDGRDPKW